MINMTETAPSQRLQLAINVSNLDESVAFYSKLFATEPAKVRPGYANFAIADPPLKLVLFEGSEGGTINHLGVEASTSEQVVGAEQRLIEAGLETTGIDDTVCCYAEKTETWLQAPDSLRWEWYVRTGDSEQMQNEVVGTDASGICCSPEALAATSSPSEADTATPAASSSCC